MNSPSAITVGGIQTARLTRSELAGLMVQDCLRAKKEELPIPRVVVSSNGFVIVKFNQNPEFRALITSADIVDADGMPLVFATRLKCQRPLLERVATTDFIHDASAAAAANGLKFFFLGAKPGVASEAAGNIQRLHPGLEIVGVRNGYFSQSDEDGICANIVAVGTDVLWVGLGSPLQESFAIRNRERLAGLGWIRTCGGLFDHHSGRIRRAPAWMQHTGLEWLHRLTQEPHRLARRYVMTNPLAIYYLATNTHD